MPLREKTLIHATGYDARALPHGLVFQVVGNSDYYGFNDDSTLPDQAEAVHSVETIAALFAQSAGI